MLTELEFKHLATQAYQRIPLVLEFSSDLDTPLALYLKVAQAQPYSFLLESVVGGEHFARYSYVGFGNHTRMHLPSTGDDRRLVYTEGDVVRTIDGNPLDAMQSIMASYQVPPIMGLPRFNGGWVGYFGYESIHHIEDIPSLPAHAGDAHFNLPDIQFILCDVLLVIDNLTAKSHLIVYANPHLPHAYAQAQQQIRQLLQALKTPPHLPAPSGGIQTTLHYGFEKHDYMAGVARIQQHIHDGNAMQVVLSQRMQKTFNDSPIAVYRALRALNPSPYMYYYRLQDSYIVGSSPELLVRLDEDDIVTLRPIAGTRPRGSNAQEDAQLAEELLQDQKECAEHTMLIDLARNDLGRIAQAGSVRVVQHMVIERYSHVQHIVSSVQAKLKGCYDAMDVFKAVFPAGTLSGAPKVSAMKIIASIEPHKRRIYGGAVGYIGFNGAMDLAIAIRTAVIHQGHIYVQAGAGIVHDSVPEKEWDEAQNKAHAVWQAIARAQTTPENLS